MYSPRSSVLYVSLFGLAFSLTSPAANAELDQWGTGAFTLTEACASFSATCSVGTSPLTAGPDIDNFQQPSATSTLSTGQGSGTGTAEFEAQTPILSNPLLRAEAFGGTDLAFASSSALMGYTYIGATPGVIDLTGTLTGTISNPVDSAFNDISASFYLFAEGELDGFDSVDLGGCIFECFSPFDIGSVALDTTGTDSATLTLSLNPGDTFYLYATLNLGAAVGGVTDSMNSLSFEFSNGSDLQSIITGGDPDADNDQIPDAVDNCIEVANINQLDADGDGIGNICDADTNNDCMVNFADLADFSALFFTNDPVADLTGDGFVNFADLEIMEDSFFGAPGPAADPNICTPAS